MTNEEIRMNVENHHHMERIADALEELLETNKEILTVLYSIKYAMSKDEEDEY